MVLVLKIKNLEDVRRLTVEHPPSFQQLTALLKQLFPTLQEPFQIKYLDEDNDYITITSDLELKESVNVASITTSSLGAHVLRLFVFGSPAKEEARATEQPKATEPPRADPPNLFGQIPLNPQLLQSVLGPLLSNPQMLQGMLSRFFGSQQQNAPSVSDLSRLFQNLGLNTQPADQTSTTPNPQQFEKLFAQVQEVLPQLLATFGNFSQFSEPPTGPNPNVNPSAKDEPEVHPGVVCDGCGNGITGIRYKCSVCSDYDLCQTCEAKGNIHEPTHVFLKIAKPLQNSGRGCPYRRPWASERKPGRGGWCASKPGVPANTPTATQSPQPRYLGRFVSDVTVEDGTTLHPEQPVVKIWKMRNEGTTAWPENTRLSYVGGDKLSNVEAVAVPPIDPGVEVDIAVDMTAPNKPGRYVSYYRLLTPDGTRFGQRVWVDVVVVPKEEKQEKEAVKVQPATETVQVTETMQVDTPAQPLYPPVSTPPAVPQPMELPVSSEHQQLLDMGFVDRALNIQLLAKNNNDVLRTVQDLLQFN